MSNLLKISEAASLGLHIMALLAADPEKLLCVREAAAALAVSEAHLAKVMQRLAKAGLVESLRGPHGGFMLARAPSEVTLLEVYEGIEGRIVVRNCLFSTRLCDGRHCIFGGMLTSVDSQIKQYLGKTKLSEIADVVQAPQEDAHA